MITLNLSPDEAIQLLQKVLHGDDPLKLKTFTEKEKKLANKIANSLGMKVVFHEDNSFSIVNISRKDEEVMKEHQELKKSLNEIIEKAQSKEKTLEKKAPKR